MTHIARLALLALLLLGVASATLRAQVKSDNRLHVLRIVPDDRAEPTDSVVVTFDRPVAPALDRSVDPAKVVRVTPAAAHGAYWRDPSSLVLVFDRPWSYGTSYRVDVEPALRSADGRRIASGEGRTIRVRQQRVLAVWPSLRSDGSVATLQRPRVALEAPVPLLSLVGRSWLVPYRCGWQRDSIPLRPESIGVVDTTEAPLLARSDGATSPLDSLRRVVRFVADGALPRECTFVVSLPADVIAEDPRLVRSAWHTAAVFRLDTIGVAHGMRRDGHITLYFNTQVTGAEVLRAVRVGGHVPTLWQEPFMGTGGDDPKGRRSQWVLGDSLAPGQSIEVVIQRDLHDVEGEELGAEVRRVVERPHAPTSVWFMPGVVVVPQDAGVLLVMSAVNADSVSVDIARIPAAKQVPALQTGRWFQGDWNSWGGEVVTRTIAVEGKTDSVRTVSIPVSLLPDGWRDDPLLLITARAIRVEKNRVPSREAVASSMRAIVQRTNLAVHASVYEGRGEVWVTALRSAAPVRNARVRVLTPDGREVAASVTDSLGRASIDYHAAADLESVAPLLDVTSGSDRVIAQLPGLATSERIRVARSSVASDDPSDDDNDGYPWFDPGARKIEHGKQLHGAAFSERGIYRPGERVFLDGVLRTFQPYGDWGTPAGDSARWTIHWMGDVGSYQSRMGSSVERMQRRVVALGRFGTTADTFDIPRGARLGEYHATLALKTSAGWRTAAKAQFVVAEYRATEFALSLESDSAVRLFAGDTAHVLAHARYLFGMPMTNAKVVWWGQISEGEPNVAGLRALAGYRVGRSWWRLPDGQQPQTIYLQRDSATLDAKGTVPIALPVSTSWPTGAMHVAVSAMDASRQTVTAERTLVVHGADAYVGIRTRSPRWFWNAGDTIPVELVVTRVDGSLRRGAFIELTALRYSWRERRWGADTVWAGHASMNGVPVTESWVPKESGWYEMLATTRDERGRATTSGIDLWVTGPRGGRIASEARDLQLTLDRQRYAPGDVISAIIDSPVEQRAWVSLSRSAPLHEQFVSLHAGPNVVKIPVPRGAIPRAELRVVGVVPLGTKLSERERYLSTAERTIEVSARDRELAVQVHPERARYAPGERVRVTVKVADATGKGARAETTIWAVDQGVGLLTGLEKPDLLGDLLGTNVVAPWQGSSLEARVLGLSPMLERPTIRIRGVGSMRSDITGSVSSTYLEEVVVTAYTEERRPAASVRRSFATTPLFVGGTVTDSSGVAEVTFTLPDNVTTYQLFATAVSAGMEAGSGDTSLVSTRPVLVRAALPRAVRLGDSLLAGGVLTQDAEGTTPVSLRVETRGIEVRGATTRTDTLRGRAAREVRFPMRVVAGDSVMVRLRGGAASGEDAVELTLPVSAAGHPRAHVVSGTMQGRATLVLPAVEGIDVGRSRVTVQLGSSVLPLVRQLSDALAVYPYGCTEQLASAGRALLARLTFERVTNPAATLGDVDRRLLESIVSRIVARQQEEGGIGYWSRDGWTSPWLTAYAAELLIDARAEGVGVPASVTHDVAAYLEHSLPDDSELQIWTDRIQEARTSHDLLASARVLRRFGVPDARLEAALDRHRDRLAFVDRLALAQLRAMAGDSVGARHLLDGAWSAARQSGQKIALDDSTRGNGWLFESRLRAIASLVQTTAELEPTHPKLGGLVESLVHRGRAERDWQWNTLDQSATANALAATRHIYGFGSARRVTVSGPTKTLATSTFEAGRSDSVALPLAALLPAARRDSTPRIALAADTVAPIFYAATLFETPRARPVRADDEGISVERWYEGYDDGKPTMSVREGQLVRVRLRVTVNGDREFVAVEDPLPAGLEAVDLNLKTSAVLEPPEWARRAAKENARGARTRGDWSWWSPWEHTEKRDDRVLYFARELGKGSWDISYVARATTAGNFVRPPAHAEEMYNPAVHGRSDGGWFTVTEASAR